MNSFGPDGISGFANPESQNQVLLRPFRQKVLVGTQYAHNIRRYTRAHRMKQIFRKVSPLLVAIGAFAFGGCTVFDPAEDIPSYVRINDITLQINNGVIEGSGSEKITDAWLYIDGQLIGAYEMPVSIPVLNEGTHNILVLAGIKQNGLSTLRAIYPNYRGWASTITLTRGQVVTVNPVVDYYPATNFVWMCDFDGAGTNIDDQFGPWPGRLEEISGAGAFEIESGYVTLDADTTDFYAQTSQPYTFNGSYDVYLEMNYSCNQPFVVGIYNIVNGEYIPWCEMLASTSWNKIYIRLNDALLTQQPGGIYHVYVAMKKSADVANPWLAIDELKLIN